MLCQKGFERFRVHQGLQDLGLLIRLQESPLLHPPGQPRALLTAARPFAWTKSSLLSGRATFSSQPTQMLTAGGGVYMNRSAGLGVIHTYLMMQTLDGQLLVGPEVGLSNPDCGAGI